MRIAILGLGGNGRALAAHLCADPRVSSLVLVDRIAERTRVLEGRRGCVSVVRKRADLADRASVVEAVRGSDVLVNTALPAYNLSIMRAALEAGAHYLDVASAGTGRLGGASGILEQLRMDGAFKAAGLTGLLSIGLDPGMTNVIARACADRLDAVDAIRIRSGGSLYLSGRRTRLPIVPTYSTHSFLDDLLRPPTLWADGRLRTREVLHDWEDTPFPPPVGVQRTFLVSHEEVTTLPRFLRKPVRHVDFMYAVDVELARALASLSALGLLRKDRGIRVGRKRVTLRQVLAAALPDPDRVQRLYRRLMGTKCVSVDVEGTDEGGRRVEHGHIAMDHSEAARRARTTAVYYLTGAAASIGAVLLGKGIAPSPGVYPPEVLDPGPILSAWRARGLPIAWSERVVPS